MNGIRKKIICILAAAVTAATLTGCSGQGGEEKTQSPTLAPAVVGVKAPDGDRTVREPGDYTIYLPGRNDLQSAGTIHLEEASVQDTAETLVRAMLDIHNAEQAGQEGTGIISLYRDRTTGREAALEISGGICTVQLDTSILTMNYSERYKFCIAMATTLCAMNEINGVNILTAGKSTALDVTGLLPTGMLTAHPGEDLQVLWEQMEGKRTPLGEDGSKTPMSAMATIYYPLTEGRGIGCEGRMVHFDGQTQIQMANTLLAALNDTFLRRYGTEGMPRLEDYLLHEPVINELKDKEGVLVGKLITIDFRENIDELLDSWGIDKPCLIAAMTCTLTSFIPDVPAVKVRDVEKPVTHIAGSRFPEQQTDGGIVYRDVATVFLMGSATVFFEKDGKLTACEMPVEREMADSPRALLSILFDGPDQQAEKNGMKRTIPEDVTEEDILGIAAEGDTLLVSLSGHFRDAIRGGGPEKEGLLCYSMVNTLCLNTGMKRVCFFFGEKQAETIAGDLYWGGEFMYNPGM